ncbi:MAG TPA: EAL domain-containing protein, partial [Dehalococcoidia bacterium]|nr:EAL domain-containing protein [Dehalococcoidia bacterium]
MMNPAAKIVQAWHLTPVTTKGAARLSATLYLASGGLVILNQVLPLPAGANRTGLVDVGALAVAIGVLIWMLPWQRWPRWSTLSLVAVALPIIVIHNHFTGSDPYRYGVFYFVVLAWTGLCHPRGVASLVGVPVTFAYLVPLIVDGAPGAGLTSALYIVPVSVLVGETLSWSMANLGHARDEIRSRDSFFRSLVSNSSDLITLIDADGVVKFQSPSAEHLLGVNPVRTAGTLIDLHIHAGDRQRFRAALAQLPAYRGPLEVRWKAASGWQDLELTISDLRDHPDVRGIVLNGRDVSERRALQANLLHQAYHDALTGLPNRVLFTSELAAAFEQASRGGEACAVLIIDLDGFKHFNDRFGHGPGDRLLVEVGARLRAAVAERGLAARLGGDEYGVLLPRHDADAALAFARELLGLLSAQHVIDTVSVSLSASIGIADATSGASPEDLVRNADIAMYAVKARGKADAVVFSPDMYETLVQRLELGGAIEDAIDAGQFVLHYQPIMDLKQRRIIGAEALVRWNHPTRGLLPPGAFIELAEENRSIVALGRWVLNKACDQAQEWLARKLVDRDFRMSVNVSVQQMAEPAFAGEVKQALERSKLLPTQLVLEITETTLMVRSETTMCTLNELRRLGVHIDIDDFGSGYSSLGYLAAFPVSGIKVDRSLVSRLGTSLEAAALMRGVVDLGQSLGLEVTAEGVELPDQLREVESLAAPLAQGYLFSPPLPADDFVAYLESADLDAIEDIARTAA